MVQCTAVAFDYLVLENEIKINNNGAQAKPYFGYTSPEQLMTCFRLRVQRRQDLPLHGPGSPSAASPLPQQGLALQQ